MKIRSERDQLELLSDAIASFQEKSERIKADPETFKDIAYALSFVSLAVIGPIPHIGLAAAIAFLKFRRIKGPDRTTNLVKRRARITSSKFVPSPISSRDVQEAVDILKKVSYDITKQVDLSKDTASYQEFHGAGIGSILSKEEGQARLSEIAVDDESTDWIASNILGVTEVADRFKVARSTVDNWRRTKRAIALQRGPRNYVYPERQFARLGPVDGIKGVLSYFVDAEEAWEWLVAENIYTGERAPIDWLHEGRVEEVMRAAEGALDFT